jgi:hypothetical protein
MKEGRKQVKGLSPKHQHNKNRVAYQTYCCRKASGDRFSVWSILSSVLMCSTT